MAKRRKDPDEEDEDKPFKLPKFDEEAFLTRERRNIKATFIAFFFGCLVALISFGFWALMSGESSNLRWPLVLIFGIFTASFIRYIYLRLNLDISHFTKKNWFSTYAIYFFVWLIVLIVLVNPPFYDDEAPKIEIAVLPEMQELGGDVLIVAKITDNVGVEKSGITFTIDAIPVAFSDFDYVDNIFRYMYESPLVLNGDETHNYILSVKDKSGKEATPIKGSFTYSNDTIYLAKPFDHDTVQAADDIKFGVQPNVWKVSYTVNDGDSINATQQDEYYVTTPKIQGWPVGVENVTVKVTAEVLYNFENHYFIDENGRLVPIWYVKYINDTSSYTFDVADESMIGKTNSEPITRPSARFVSAPGFEAIVFIAALLVVVLIFKYKKKNRSNK